VLGNNTSIDPEKFRHLLLAQPESFVVETDIDPDAVLRGGVEEDRSFFHEKLLSIAFTIFSVLLICARFSTTIFFISL